MLEFIPWCPCCMQYETSDEHLERCALGEAKTRIANLVKEVERLTSCLQYEQHRLEHIGTHGPGCYAWGPRHYECAVGEIEALRGDSAAFGSILTDEHKQFLRDNEYELKYLPIYADQPDPTYIIKWVWEIRNKHGAAVSESCSWLYMALYAAIDAAREKERA